MIQQNIVHLQSQHNRLIENSIKTVHPASSQRPTSHPPLSLLTDAYTHHVNPYFVAEHYNTVSKTSKHYYMGAQRVATNLGTYEPPISGPGGPSSGFKRQNSTHPLVSNLTDILSELRLDATHEYNVEALITRADYATYHGTTDSGQAHKTEDNTAPAFRLMYWYHTSTLLSAGTSTLLSAGPDLIASRATLARSAARFSNVMREFGHVEYITDRDGLPLALSGVEVYQYFWYSPWGETLHEQKASSPNGWGIPYRFNGKELDEETGLYYYGARYYTCPERLCRFGDPMVSVWLGVDAMAFKFPNSSPYVFTANNPIVMIDPDGNDVWLIGELADDALCELQKNTTSIILYKDSYTGLLSYEKRPGIELDDAVQRIVNAIDDCNVNVNLIASNEDFTSEGTPLLAGAFIGGIKDSETGKVTTWNYLNPEISSIADAIAVFGPGSTALHELSEGHEAAKYMIDNEINQAGPAIAGETNSVYDHAHSRAYPQSTKYYTARFDSRGNRLDKKNYDKTKSLILYTRTPLGEQIDLKQWKK